ncbi:hypothetical protein CEXT_673411 [Caerostris extrusa]|uniref:Uncharacterized protein n=1 Tax=Caerostris extrusa TaxID=172846 RepID=A0AAV4XHY1_CAEEX|nr:hypothetical protein CEXT_673411 [Caerostris extrusa]
MYTSRLDKIQLCTITINTLNNHITSSRYRNLIDYSLMVASDLSNEQKSKLVEILQTCSGTFSEMLKLEAKQVKVKRKINSGTSLVNRNSHYTRS